MTTANLTIRENQGDHTVHSQFSTYTTYISGVLLCVQNVPDIERNLLGFS